MNFKEKNGIFSATKTIMTKIIDQTDETLKTAIIEYAQKRSMELGQEIEVLFLDKEIANKIIDLGVKEYLKAIQEDEKYKKLKSEIDEALKDGGIIEIIPEDYPWVSGYLMKNGISLLNHSSMYQRITSGSMGEGDVIEINISKKYI